MTMEFTSSICILILSSVLCCSASNTDLPVVLNTWAFTLASDTGYDVMRNGVSALDAVHQGITACEMKPCAKNPLNPNVGFGGKPDETGETTLDALIMDGKTHSSGAVGCLRRIKNAIGVARAVMNYTKHSLLVGDLATQFATKFGFPEESLTTNNSKKTWQDGKTGRTETVSLISGRICQVNKKSAVDLTHFQTLHVKGMVAVDSHGNVAAGTSTNGLGFKIHGRVGDSPIAGAGAYADNEIGAAAATGNGDIMTRFLPTYQAVEFMRQGHSPAKAAELALLRIHKYYNNAFSGSIIAVNKKGEYGTASYKWTTFRYAVRNPKLGKSVVGEKKPFDPARVQEPPCTISSVAMGLKPKCTLLGITAFLVLIARF